MHKLFLLLALAIALALGLLGGITALNLQRGFIVYVNTLDLARLTPLAQALEQRADAAQGFDSLRDETRWNALLRDNLPMGPPQDRPVPPPPPPVAPPLSRHGDGAARLSPPPPPLSFPLPFRVSLLDARHRTVAGAPPAADAMLRPLQHDGTVVGWLAMRPLQQAVESRDTHFLSAQLRSMVMLAGLLLLLALAVAWLFARHLLAPLREVEHAADQLAGGVYQLHLDTTRRDELGDLVRHINRLSAALQSHETARRRWIADISHELRTPLSIVRGEVEAMQDGVRALDADGLASLHDEVMRLDRLVDDLHQLSMADLGTLSYQPQRCDMAVLIHAACARFATMAKEAGIDLQCELPANVIVQIDPDRMRQLLDNVIGNSLRYSDRGGRLLIAVVNRQHAVDITFDDTPPGVNGDSLTRLFEPLFRGEASRARKHGGSGLGLAIAQRIALAHGGELHALPSALGGLRIVLTVPLAEG